MASHPTLFCGNLYFFSQLTVLAEIDAGRATSYWIPSLRQVLGMLTAEAINPDTAKVIRKARNRLRSVGRRFRDVQVQDDPSFVSFLNRRNGVVCWFDAQTDPQLHAIARQFESSFEPGEERTAVICAALRVW